MKVLVVKRWVDDTVTVIGRKEKACTVKESKVWKVSK